MIFGTNKNGRRNGTGAILMKDQEAAEDCLKLFDQGEIGGRTINLEIVTYHQYVSFNGPIKKEAKNEEND